MCSSILYQIKILWNFENIFEFQVEWKYTAFVEVIEIIRATFQFFELKFYQDFPAFDSISNRLFKYV